MVHTAGTGGSLNPFDPFHSSIDDMPFGDELLANLFDNTDASDTTLCAGTDGNLNDLVPSSLSLSKLTEPIELSPRAMSTSHCGNKSQETHIPADSYVSTNDSSSSPHLQQGFALPPLRPITPSNSFRPKHNRRQSSLRHEYCPIEPSTDLPACTVQDLSASGTWTSSPSHYRQTRFTPTTELSTTSNDVARQQVEISDLNSQHQPVNMLLPSPDFTGNGTMHSSQQGQYQESLAASQAENGYIHTTQYPYAESLRHQHLPAPQTSYLLPQLRERSHSAPTAQQQLEQAPMISTATSRKMAPLKHHRGFSSPSLHSSPNPNHAVAASSAKREPMVRQSTVLSAREYEHEKKYVGLLISAMRDMTKTEDNPGMLDTWRKIMKSKKAKIDKICQELYELIRKAQDQNGEPLGEKRPLFVYPNFKERFDGICETLKTQKTICKHLLEDPYVYQVVDDPLNALKRVQNNRRVNQQKKEAIEEGRKRLGVRGRGKGISLEPTSAFEEQSEADDDVSPVKEEFSSPEQEYVPPSKALRPLRAATKRRYAPIPDEGDEEDGADVPSPPKKAKRQAHKRVQSTASAYSSDVHNSESVPYESGDETFGSSPPSRQDGYAPITTYQDNDSYYDHSYSDVHDSHSFPSHNGSTYQFNGLTDQGYGDMRFLPHDFTSSPFTTQSLDHPSHQRHYSSGSVSEISPLDNGQASEHF